MGQPLHQWVDERLEPARQPLLVDAEVAEVARAHAENDGGGGGDGFGQRA